MQVDEDAYDFENKKTPFTNLLRDDYFYQHKHLLNIE